jgi:hypothetical protein
MRILCDVNQAECLRYGVDAPSSTVKIDVDPKFLTEDQRNFIADHLYDGLRFPKFDEFNICPPTYEGFIAAVNFGLECKKSPNDGNTGELKEIRRNLVKAAIEGGQETLV